MDLFATNQCRGGAYQISAFMSQKSTVFNQTCLLASAAGQACAHCAPLFACSLTPADSEKQNRKPYFMGKIVSLPQAVLEFIQDGDTVARSRGSRT